jgi:hypothetical protein
MAAPEDVYREFGKRTNRVLAAYLAVIAWVRDLDCVALDRDELIRLWGLKKRVEEQRQNWLKNDVKRFFPYFKSLVYAKGPQKFAGVFLSRRPFPEGCFADSLVTAKRVKLMTNNGLKSGEVKLPPETEMLAYLTSIVHGLIELPSETDLDLFE